MSYPEFFNHCAPIDLYDSLSQFLGVCSDGILRFHYIDVVKLAGHSCVTVAGAYLMVQRGLEALYAHQLPNRGEIIVTIGGARDEGVNGVIGGVAGLICGAAAEEGFKGISGNFVRTHLLRFDPTQSALMHLERLDTHSAVSLHYFPQRAGIMSIDPELKAAALRGEIEAQKNFATLWQRNVEAVLSAPESKKVIEVI